MRASEPCLTLPFVPDHLVEQLRVGEGGALRGQVIAAVGCVGVEVFFRQAHLGQVFAGGAVAMMALDGDRWSVVMLSPQHRQRTHALERALAGQRAFPVRRAADVGAHAGASRTAG